MRPLCRFFFKPSVKGDLGLDRGPGARAADDVEQTWKSDAGLLGLRPGAAGVALRTGSGVRRQTVRLVIASTIVSIVCLLLVGGTAVFLLLQGLWAVDTSQGGEEGVCLPCVQLCPTPLSDVTRRLVASLDVTMEGADEMCCANTSQQLAAVFRLILLKQSEAQTISDVLDQSAQNNITSSVSAHLTLKSGAMKDDIPDQVLQWKRPEESALSHVRPGLTLKDDMVYVLSTGVYYVYCQVLYDTDASGEHAPGVLSAYVYRDSLVSPRSSGMVLKTHHTRNNEGAGRHSSYVGGLVALHKGDKLYVSVSHRHLVSNDEKASFFGLLRVGR